MTPEDTPNMTERTDRQAQIDPWASVEAELLKAIGHPHVTVADLPPDTFVARFFAARSADAALLRERDAQIASLTAQVEQERHRAETFESAAGKALDARDTLRAERDAAQQENKTLREALDNSDMEVELLEAYVEDLRTICEQANIDPDAARVALSSSPRPQEPQP